MTILSVSKTQSGSSLLAPLLTTLCFQCRFEWVPTAKWPRGAEAVNAKIKRLSTRFGAKRLGAVNFKVRTY